MFEPLGTFPASFPRCPNSHACSSCSRLSPRSVACGDAGELRVEVLRESGEVIKRFSRGKCVPIPADGTLQSVRWKGQKGLSGLADKPENP